MPGLSVTYTVPQGVLDETRAFLYHRGLEGCEGAALWIGRPHDETIQITRVCVPEQRCIKTPWGIAVDLTEHAHYTLTDQLESGERFVARIHSHPREAYHSDRDDANAVITHEGAISVVVPYFARLPLDLPKCAVYRLALGRGWLQLSPAEIQETFKVVS